MGNRRIAITGTGIVIAHGRDREKVWSKILAGESGVDRIHGFNPEGLTTQIASEVLYPVDTVDQVGPYPVRAGAESYLVAAAQDALDQAGMSPTVKAGRKAAVLASGVGPPTMVNLGHAAARHFGSDDNLRRKSLDEFYPMQQSDPISEDLDGFWLDRAGPMLAVMLGADQVSAVASACASGSHALADGGSLIRRGEADTVLVAGVCTAVSRVMIPGFAKIQALSSRNDDPHGASRPFDAGRDGFVMAEGASALVLEDLEQAQARGATILGELLGWGYASDAYRLTDPLPDGTGMCSAMQRALESGGRRPDQVDYVNAHGTSTQYNDAAETLAIKMALGEEHARRIPVSSTKSMTGHLIHAAGTTEAIFCLMACRDGQVPPTINYETPDPACDLDYVPNKSRTAKVRTALSNSFGFGGQNVSVLIGRWEDA